MFTNNRVLRLRSNLVPISLVDEAGSASSTRDLGTRLTAQYGLEIIFNSFFLTKSIPFFKHNNCAGKCSLRIKV